MGFFGEAQPKILLSDGWFTFLSTFVFMFVNYGEKCMIVARTK